MQTDKPLLIHQAGSLLRAQSSLGEGSLWDPREGLLYWVDILGKILHIYNPATGEDRELPTGAFVSTVVPIEGSKDVLVALHTGLYRMNTTTGALTFVASPETGEAIRFNEGKCDPSGRFWAGTMARVKTPGAGMLYRLDGDGTLHEMLQGITISNGIVWTADRKTMYYIDTPTSCIQAFDYEDATGNIAARRTAFRIPTEEGFPDGMSIDAEGKVWIAMWGAGCINRYDPETGVVLQKVGVPAPNTSSCAFGGKDLKTLFITTARAELSTDELEKFPQSGDLFSVDLGVAGVPANSYRLS